MSIHKGAVNINMVSGSHPSEIISNLLGSAKKLSINYKKVKDPSVWIDSEFGSWIGIVLALLWIHLKQINENKLELEKNQTIFIIELFQIEQMKEMTLVKCFFKSGYFSVYEGLSACVISGVSL